jgi:hypothetical protein
MTTQLVDGDAARWRHFVKAESVATAARMELFKHRTDLVGVLRRGLDEPGERAAALDIAARLTPEELQQLFPDLLALVWASRQLVEFLYTREEIGVSPRNPPPLSVRPL